MQDEERKFSLEERQVKIYEEHLKHEVKLKRQADL